MKHKHHIIPKHAGGSDEPENLIELTKEDHAEAHRILWEKNGMMADYIAWKMLSGDNPDALLEERLALGRTPEAQAKSAANRIGHIQTKETRNKISQALKGRIIDDEWRQKMSDSHKNQYCNPLTSVKLSKANTGKIRTDEHKANYSNAKKRDWKNGKYDGLKDKLRTLRLGSKASPETKEKMRNSQLARWAAKKATA